MLYNTSCMGTVSTHHLGLIYPYAKKDVQVAREDCQPASTGSPHRALDDGWS